MDKKYLVSASKDKTVRLWDLESLECKRVLHADFGRFIPLVVDARYLYTYAPSDGIIVWSWETGEIIQKIKCDLGGRDCALAVDDHYLYGAEFPSDNNVVGVGIWSKDDWMLKRFLPTGRGKSGECSRLILDGYRLYALCLLTMVEWNLSDYKEIIRWDPIHADVYTFSLDLHYLYFGPYVFSRISHQLIAQLFEDSIKEYHFVVNDEDFVYITSTDEQYANVWDKETWKLHQRLALPGHDSRWEALTISNKSVFLGGAKDITIWSKQTWQCEHVLTGHSDWIWNLLVF